MKELINAMVIVCNQCGTTYKSAESILNAGDKCPRVECNGKGNGTIIEVNPLLVPIVVALNRKELEPIEALIEGDGDGGILILITFGGYSSYIAKLPRGFEFTAPHQNRFEPITATKTINVDLSDNARITALVKSVATLLVWAERILK
jgi:hypothetical protein